MKPISALALVNSALAVASTLLAAVPIPGALLAFALFAPIAAYFARKNQTIAALCVPVSAAVALAVSPLQLNHATVYLFGLWCAWVVGWSTVVLYFSRTKLFALVNAARGGGVHGA